MERHDWSIISRLLDEALELPPAERATWIERLPPEHAALRPRLEVMLAQASVEDDEAFLAALPKLDLASLAGDGLSLRAGYEGALVGPYRLLREIASGGQGSVWLAERVDGLIDRPVALKLPIGLGFRPLLADRIARERSILASLTHPNIARLYDAGVAEDGAPYLALEYVDGVAIDRHCDDKRLTVRERVLLFLQVVRAVAYAHGQLVLHRDLKPSNVLVTAAGESRLLDFGIAKLLDDERQTDSTLTEVGGRAMTLQYASPEQVSRAPLHVATDIYSLGAMFYEVLTGTRPYTPARDSVAALEEAILHDDPRKPSDVAADSGRRKALAGDLDTIVLKALKKLPADRYDTAAALADDLQRYLDGRPVLAQPDRAAYKIRKFVARHRLAVAGTTLATVAVLGGAGAAVWQAQVARAEQARAEAVTAFIGSIFKDVDPTVRPENRPFTAVDVLNLARERLGATLSAEPEVRIDLMRILGDSLTGVGAPGNAVTVLQQALDESRRVHGADDPVTIDAALLLAAAAQSDTTSSTADAALDEAIAALERTGRRDSDEWVRAQVIRSQVLINRGQSRVADAALVAQQAYDAAMRVLAPGHLLTAHAAQSLSSSYRQLGKSDLSLRYAEAAYRGFLDANGGRPQHPRVVRAQNVYGRALFENDRPAEAIHHMKEAAANGEVVFRESGLDQQHLLGTLANIQLAYGEVREAVTNLERALAADLGGAKVSNTYVGSQYGVQARAYMAARRPADAVPYFERAIELLAKDKAENFLRTQRVEYAGALIQLGRLQDARAVLAVVRVVPGPRVGATDLLAMRLHAQLQLLDGQRERAMQRLEEAAALTPSNPGSRVVWSEIRIAMGQVLLDRGRTAEAAQAFSDADEMIRRVQGVATPIWADIDTGRGRVALAEGRAADARGHFDRANRFWQAFAPAHPEAAAAARRLERAR